MRMRISRALAMAGIDSRRKCEVHVQNGAVIVNGVVVRDLGRQVDLETDEVLFRGRPVLLQKHVYYILHKPIGYITTAGDPHATKTVYDLLPRTLVPRTARPSQSRMRVFPVGRLDKDSSGLLFFTSDGDLANRLMHPRYGAGKWYEVRLNRAFELADRGRLLGGVKLEDGMAKAEKFRPLSRRTLHILMKEGRNREVRRLFEALGYRVLELCRVGFGPLMLGSLAPSEGRFLNNKEIASLKLAR